MNGADINRRPVHNRRARRAFTLIEIMVVVIVLGILAAVVIPNLAGRTDEARVAKARSDIETLSLLIQSFRLDMRRYPTEEEGLAVLREEPTGEDAELWKGPYTNKPIPKDPWGNEYIYTSPAENGIDEWGIESYGADGEPGGEGFDRDINTWTNYADETEE